MFSPLPLSIMTLPTPFTFFQYGPSLGISTTLQGRLRAKSSWPAQNELHVLVFIIVCLFVGFFCFHFILVWNLHFLNLPADSLVHGDLSSSRILCTPALPGSFVKTCSPVSQEGKRRFI